MTTGYQLSNFIQHVKSLYLVLITKFSWITVHESEVKNEFRNNNTGQKTVRFKTKKSTLLLRTVIISKFIFCFRFVICHLKINNMPLISTFYMMKFDSCHYVTIINYFWFRFVISDPKKTNTFGNVKLKNCVKH